MKKVTFGIDTEYTPTKNGWKKSPAIYPKWSGITTAQAVGPKQTTMMRMGEEFGVMCLDLDTKDPNHPDAKIMMEEIYQLAPTATQETQNGYHFFYKWNKRLAKSSSKITKTKDSKLDIKSNMGLVAIKAPVAYYKWFDAKHDIQEFTDKMWSILRKHLTNKYLGIPLTKQDEIAKLDELIELREENPTELIDKKILKQKRKIDNHNKINNFNDSEVQNAKDYPIRKLLNEPTADVIRCISPDHTDTNPSMQITGNFAYCHGCGEHFDSLSIYQTFHDCDFKEALNALTK